MKQEAMRSCIGCDTKKPKKEPVRIVREPNGNIYPNTSGHSNSRRAHLYRGIACLRRCRGINRLNRTFREQATSSVYAALEKEFAELNDGPYESD